MYRMKILFLLVALVCLHGQAHAGSGDLPLLRVAVNAPYPPFAVEDEQGRLSGFDVDIAQALCTELRRTCVVKNLAFDHLLPSLVAGEMDIVIAGLGASPERQKIVDFTDRYFRSLSIFVGKGSRLSSVTPETAKGLRFGAQAESMQEQYLRKHFTGIATFELYEDFTIVLEKVKSGEVDIGLVDGLPAYVYLKSDAGADLEVVGDPLPSEGILDSSSIAVSKKRPGLREQINEALHRLRRNGEYERINRKYFDFSIY